MARKYTSEEKIAYDNKIAQYLRNYGDLQISYTKLSGFMGIPTSSLQYHYPKKSQIYLVAIKQNMEMFKLDDEIEKQGNEQIVANWISRYEQDKSFQFVSDLLVMCLVFPHYISLHNDDVHEFCAMVDSESKFCDKSGLLADFVAEIGKFRLKHISKNYYQRISSK